MSAPASGITVVAADDDLATIDAWHHVFASANAVDTPDVPPPDRHELGIAWSNPKPGAKYHRALAYLDGVAAGTILVVMPTLDNLENCDVVLTVAPEYRRRGVGRALLDSGLAVARQNGRTRFSTTGVATLDGGPVVRDEAPTRFAEAMGMKRALVEVRRRLDLSTVERDLYDRLLADSWPHASGYSAVSWGTVTPEEYVDDFAELEASFLEEAPLGDLEWEPEKIDADRVRKNDAANQRYGRRVYTTVMRHDASGKLVALTAVVRTYEQIRHAWQGITLVHPAHRGHRLGVLGKVVNLQKVLESEPELQTIDTWNAQVNDHMIAINEAMGFRPVDVLSHWQRDV